MQCYGPLSNGLCDMWMNSSPIHQPETQIGPFIQFIIQVPVGSTESAGGDRHTDWSVVTLTALLVCFFRSPGSTWHWIERISLLHGIQIHVPHMARNGSLGVFNS
jgi:hypothetical protein